MSPFHDLFSSAEFWSALILALLGGGGIGGLVGAWSNSRKTEADIDGITADATDEVWALGSGLTISDMIHPTAEGAVKLGQILGRHIKQALQEG